MIRAITLALLLSAAVLCRPSLAATPEAQWTILVFMNGHNSLDQDINVNFRQMALVGSTTDVNIITQIAKLGNSPAEKSWADKAFRFRITKGMGVDPKNAVATLGKTDMGDPKTVKEFLSWGAANYPAKNFMLIMWGHGQGYRLQLASQRLENALKLSAPSSRTLASVLTITRLPVDSPLRSVSSDDIFGSKIYMRDLETVLQDVIANDTGFHHEKLALVGFDACLMAMVENSYAFRATAQFLVGSEELIPGAGWPYDRWLMPLVGKPTTTPRELGTGIVDAYAAAYSVSDKTTTLAEIDLSKGDSLAQSISSLATELIANLPGAIRDIRAARGTCREYAPNAFGDGIDYFHHIDLGCFLDGLTKSSNAAIAQRAVGAKSLLSNVVLRNYVGSDRTSFGSHGLAIYYPKNKSDFDGDSYAEGGYLKTNTDHPVEFVQNMKWADFLQQYYLALN